MANIGMMDGAFFVGRKEIVDWINDTLDLNLTKVEQTASGAVACQLLDIMHPGQVPMHKVNWAAKQDFDFIGNYKILQNCFIKLKIDRHVDVDRLIKGRYQDNFEFLQWYKRFFELSSQGRSPDYDCAARRATSKSGAQYTEAFGRGSTASSGAATAVASKLVQNKKVTKESKPTSTIQQPASNNTSTTAAAAAAPVAKDKKVLPPKPPAAAGHSKINEAVTSSHTTSTHVVTEELSLLRRETEELRESKLELKLEVDRLEKERDFYFEKLRDIEMMLQDLEDNGEGTPLTANIFKILYATTDGFEAGDATSSEQINGDENNGETVEGSADGEETY